MPDKLTSNQTKALAALLEQPTLEKAAEKAGVNVKTLYRWIRQAEFREALQQAEATAIETLSRRVLGMGEDAVTALGDVLKNPAQAGAGNKRMAASEIITRLFQWQELLSMQEQLSELRELTKDVPKT